LPPGEGTSTVVHAYTSLSGACVARVRAAARPCGITRSTHAQVPLDGRLCQALSGAASGSIVLIVLRPTVSVDKLLRASTKLMRSRRQQGPRGGRVVRLRSIWPWELTASGICSIWRWELGRRGASSWRRAWCRRGGRRRRRRRPRLQHHHPHRHRRHTHRDRERRV
jgi:hypothetical protein